MRHFFLLLSIFSIVIACSSDNTENGNTESPEEGEPVINCDETKPVIENLLVDIGPWDNNDPGEAGDFTFDSSFTLEQHIYAFGEFIHVTKQLPNIEFHSKQTAQVRSPITGTITRIEPKDNPDRGFEIFIKPSSDSCFTILVDHVRNLTVNVNDNVNAHDVLGNPGKFGATLGQVELQINDDKNKGVWCAMALMDNATQTTYQGLINDFRSDWETLASDTDVYDESLDWEGNGLCHEDFILETDLVNE